jgi:hypothetical protein
MSVTVDSVVVAAGDQISADLDGEAVVLGLDKGMYYGLGDVGSRIWELVHESTSVADIRDTIVAEYDVDETTCQRDLLRFLQQLEGEGLLVVTDEASR